MVLGDSYSASQRLPSLLEYKNTYIGKTKWILMAPGDTWSNEAERSVCARNWTLFTTLLSPEYIHDGLRHKLPVALW